MNLFCLSWNFFLVQHVTNEKVLRNFLVTHENIFVFLAFCAFLTKVIGVVYNLCLRKTWICRLYHKIVNLKNFLFYEIVFFYSLKVERHLWTTLKRNVMRKKCHVSRLSRGIIQVCSPFNYLIFFFNFRILCSSAHTLICNWCPHFLIFHSLNSRFQIFTLLIKVRIFIWIF